MTDEQKKKILREINNIFRERDKAERLQNNWAETKRNYSEASTLLGNLFSLGYDMISDKERYQRNSIEVIDNVLYILGYRIVFSDRRTEAIDIVEESN